MCKILLAMSPWYLGCEHVLGWCLNIVYAEIPPKGYATHLR
jgi:hypothetical protein